MPSPKGQRPKTILRDAEAIAKLEQLATENPDLATVINELGQRILKLLGVVGLRWDRDSVIYDVAFVHVMGRQRAFVTFTTPSYRGTWKRNEAPPPGALLVEVRVNPVSSVIDSDSANWLRPKQFPAQGGGGWHNGYICANGHEMGIAFKTIEKAHYSWN